MPSPSEQMRGAVAAFLRRRSEGKAETLEAFLTTTGFGREVVGRLLAELDSQPLDASTEHFGRYRILAQLGRGGMGTVHLAHDSQLGRDVALKRIRPELLLSDEARARFDAETKAAARLEHPNVCRLFDAGEHAGQPFLVLQYVPGQSLAAMIQASSRDGQPPLGTDACLALTEKVARALHHAHERGLVHRDVKPSNILVGADGEPYLIDFGLARAVERSEALTMTGATPGTIRYMSPEQLAGQRDLDGRTDVFSLALVLAETLTLRHPFAASTEAGCAHAIQHSEPELSSRTGRRLSGDLRMVLKTALAKAPGDRYPTALAFAEDLARVRNHEPIVAVQPTRARRLRRWMWRRRVAAAVGTLLLLSTIVASFLAARAQEREREATRLAHAVSALLRTQDAVGEPEAALAAAVAAAEANREHGLDTVLWQRLDACGRVYRFQRRTPDWSLVGTPAIAPDGRTYAMLDARGDLLVFAMADGQLLHRHRAHPGVTNYVVTCVAFDPSQPRLFTGGTDGVVKAWRTDDWRLEREWPIIDGAIDRSNVEAVAVSPSGRLLAACDARGNVLLWDARRDTCRRVARNEPSGVGSIDIAPDDSKLLVTRRPLDVSWAEFTALAVLDAADGSTLWTCEPSGDAFASAAWHPSSRWLAAGSLTGKISVFEASGGACIDTAERPSHDPAVRFCGFDRDGTRLLAGVSPGWEVFTFAEGRLTSAHAMAHPRRQAMTAAGIDPSGALAAAMFRDGSLLFLRTSDWSVLQAFAAPPYATSLCSVIWAGDSILAARNHDILGWHAPPRPWLPQWYLHRAAVSSVDVHPEGMLILTASEDGTVCLVPRAGGAPTVLDIGTPVRAARFALAGRRFVVTDRKGNLWVYDTATAQTILTTRGTLAQFVDENELVVADGALLRRVRAADGKSTTLHEHAGPIHALALDRRNGGVWTGGADRDAWWNSWTDERLGRPIATQGRGFERGSRMGRVTALAYVPERDVLLCSVCNSQLMILTGQVSNDPHRSDKFPDRFGGLIALDPRALHAVCSDFGFGRITWIDLASRDFAIAVQSDVHTQAVTAIRFSPRGDLCLTASLDGTVQVWDAATRTIRSTLHLDGTTVQDACFTQDGEWIVTGDGRGQVRSWPVDPLPAARAHVRMVDRRR